MPNLKEQRNINVALQYVRFANKSGSHVNCFRYFPNNTDEHEDAKYKIFKMLRKKGHSLLVEAIFENGSRADIIDLSSAEVIEIMKTETEAKMINKTAKYPYVFGVIGLYAAQVLDEGFEL